MGETIKAALAATLRAERAAKQITIAELAVRVGLSERTVIRQLNEQRDIDVYVLDDYARAFGMAGSDLLRMAEEREERAATTR